MLTVKVISAPGAELIVPTRQVRSTGQTIYYENEHRVEIGIEPLDGCDVYVMNDAGATVAKYSFPPKQEAVTPPSPTPSRPHAPQRRQRKR